MNKRNIQYFLFFLCFYGFVNSLSGGVTKVIEFEIAEEPFSWGGGNLFVVDVNGDSYLDFVIRGKSGIYIYEQDGDSLWYKAINLPLEHIYGVQEYNQGVTYGAGDVDGDNQVEIVALDDYNTLHVFDPISNTTERSIPLAGYLLDEQKCAHVAVVNLRGRGERDAIVQTNDLTPEKADYEYYINRSLIALNLETGDTLWTVAQDNTDSGGYYEGYWGVAHGPFFAADVDWDGLDEVVGGNMIDDDGSEIDLGYEQGWIYNYDGYIDHLDAIGVGDLRPDLPGLEWVVTEEDDRNLKPSGYINYWHTVLMSKSGPIWESETEDYPDGGDREPQNVAMGNFDVSRDYCEVWNRSRFNGSTTSDPQRPWVYDYDGTQFANYSMLTVLPSGFNNAGNEKGIEMIWTIDWDGSGKEYIAGKARKATGTQRNIGIFDATDGQKVWTSMELGEDIANHVLYVADIVNDPREELVIYDVNDSTLKVFTNSDADPGGLTDKWDDQLYRRLKQNWNYYSPGGYTQPPEPAVINLTIFLDGPYDPDLHKMVACLGDSIPILSPYSEAPFTVDPVPANIIDWILIELRTDSTGSGVFSKSGFLLESGHVTDSDGIDDGLDLRVLENDYYVVIHFRNHLSVMSGDVIHLTPGSSVPYDFTGDSSQFYGSGGAKELEEDVWGMWGGDMNEDGEVTRGDYSSWFDDAVAGESGYRTTDLNLDGQVTSADYVIWFNNLKGDANSTVP